MPAARVAGVMTARNDRDGGMARRLDGRWRLAWACAAIALTAVVWACSSGASAPSDARVGADAPPSARALRQGSLVSADTLANTRIGGPPETALAFRFRAGRTGSVSGVRFYIVANRAGRSGYSGGTGGSLRVALSPDSGGSRHVPADRPLASAVVRTPNRKAWPLVRFSKPASVVAGRLYHVVFTNVDQEPRENYISVNALLSHERGQLKRAVPGGLATLLGRAREGGAKAGRWRPRTAGPGERYVPIMDLVAGGRHSGVGYMEVWVNNPKPIGGEAAVRQTFRAPAGRRITGAWLRVRRTQRTSVPLQLRIDQQGAGTLAAADVPARAVPSSGHGWVRATFPQPVSLPAGTALALTAVSRETAAYEAFPIRQGTEFGFGSGTVFDGGYAQFSDGDDWLGWDQWGARDRRDGDLQFALETDAG
jgi:hypothetical protein